MKTIGRWAMAGAIIGAIEPYVIKALAWAGIGIKQIQATYVDIPFKTTDPALANWIFNMLNVQPPTTFSLLGIPIGSILMTAIAGAVLFAVGGWIYEAIGYELKQPGRLIAALAFGTLIGGWIANGFAIPTWAALTPLIVGSAIAGTTYYLIFTGLEQKQYLP